MTETIYTGKNLKEALMEASRALQVSVDEIEYTILDEGKPGFLGLLGGKDTVIRVLFDEMEAVLRQRDLRIKEEEKQIEETARLEREAKEQEARVRKEFELAEKKRQEKEVALKQEISQPKVDAEEVSKQAEASVVSYAVTEVHPQVEAGIRTFLNPILDQLVSHYRIDIRQEGDRIFVKILNLDAQNFGILIGKRGVTLDALQYLLSIVANSHSEQYVKITLDTENYRNKREEALIALAHRMANKALRERRRISLNPMNPFERRIIHTALQKVDGIATFSEGKEPYRRVVIEVE